MSKRSQNYGLSINTCIIVLVLNHKNKATLQLCRLLNQNQILQQKLEQ